MLFKAVSRHCYWEMPKPVCPEVWSFKSFKITDHVPEKSNSSQLFILTCQENKKHEVNCFLMAAVVYEPWQLSIKFNLEGGFKNSLHVNIPWGSITTCMICCPKKAKVPLVKGRAQRLYEYKPLAYSSLIKHVFHQYIPSIFLNVVAACKHTLLFPLCVMWPLLCVSVRPSGALLC